MIARRTLLKDLAQQLNLSIATVSRALAGVPSVSPATQQRVRELANSLNFQVNLLAAGLRRGRTGVIGVIVPALTGHFFPEVLHSITTAASQAKLRVIICESNEDEQQEQEQLLWLLTAQVDGLLVSAVNATGPISHIEAARRQAVPIVFFHQAIDYRQVNCVLLNYYQGAYESVQHLAAQYRTRIAYLTGDAHLSAFRDQQRGYAEALEDQGLLLDQRLVRTGDLTLAAGRQHMLALLSGAVVPDAIFASHELVAIGAMQVIQEHGLRVPEDIALAAFANESLAALTMPALTSFNQQGSEMGKAAVHLLLKLLEDTHQVIASQHLVLNPTLRVRESSVATKLRPLPANST
jgi:LacI family transcriptional regulator